MQVSFVIDDGPKAKVKEITFDGNNVFSDGKLRGQHEEDQAGGLLEPELARGQDHLHRGQVDGRGDDPRGDQGRLEDFYLNHGYVTATVGQPKITYTDGKPGSSRRSRSSG